MEKVLGTLEMNLEERKENCGGVCVCACVHVCGCACACVCVRVRGWVGL